MIMKYVLLKLLPILLVYYCQYSQTNPNEKNYLMFGNTNEQGSIIKTGDSMQCEVIETNYPEYNKNDLHAVTTSSLFYNIFYNTTKVKKCFSFLLRTTVYPCLIFSATPAYINGQHIEVILEYFANIVLRKDFDHVSITKFKDLVNRQELRGFWIRWLDDQLIEIGRNTDHNPIVSYKLPAKLAIKYFSFLSYTDTAEWIIHDDPHCGAYNITQNVQVESKCKVGTTTLIGNTIDQEYRIKTGDLMECEVTKTNSQEYNKNYLHALTTSSIGYHFFYQTSKVKKCFSFQLRSTVFPCLALSETAAFITGEHIEVILEYIGNIVLRKDFSIVSTNPFKGIVNRQELRGFWIRWLDDQLLEIGRNTDHNPIVSYRLPAKLFIKYFSFFSYTDTAEWIIHDDPHCGAYNITKNVQVESNCKIGTMKVNSGKKYISQKSQRQILNQIKNQHRIFKVNKLRSEEILLVYQELIEKLFTSAEENQYRIYSEDNEIYSPLKSVTFDEIIEEYFEFMAELKMELVGFKQKTPSEINYVNDFERCRGCCSYRIPRN